MILNLTSIIDNPDKLNEFYSDLNKEGIAWQNPDDDPSKLSVMVFDANQLSKLLQKHNTITLE